jgi:hypothetical protein
MVPPVYNVHAWTGRGDSSTTAAVMPVLAGQNQTTVYAIIQEDHILLWFGLASLDAVLIISSRSIDPGVTVRVYMLYTARLG